MDVGLGPGAATMWKSLGYLLVAALLALLGGCVYGPDHGYVRGDGYYDDAWYGGSYGPSYYYDGWYTPGYYYYGYAPFHGYPGGYYGHHGHGHHGHGNDPYPRARDYPGAPRPPGYSGSTTRGQPPMAGGTGRSAMPSRSSSPSGGRHSPPSMPSRSSSTRAPHPGSRSRSR